MVTFLLVLHLIITLALIGVVLVQRSEGGALGIGGGSVGGGFMSARGAANFLTRTTAVLAALFMANSLLLAVLSGTQTAGQRPNSIMQTPTPAQTAPAAPVQVPTNN